MLCINFGEVLHDIFYLRYSSGIHIALKAVLLKVHAKLTPGWVLNRVNFDSIQEIGPKVGGRHSFMSGPFFARLWYYTFVYSDVFLVRHKTLSGCYITGRVLWCNVFCLPEGCPPSLQETSDNPEHDVAEEQMVS